MPISGEWDEAQVFCLFRLLRRQVHSSPIFYPEFFPTLLLMLFRLLSYHLPTTLPTYFLLSPPLTILHTSSYPLYPPTFFSLSLLPFSSHLLSAPRPPSSSPFLTPPHLIFFYPLLLSPPSPSLLHLISYSLPSPSLPSLSLSPTHLHPSSLSPDVPPGSREKPLVRLIAATKTKKADKVTFGINLITTDKN